MPCGTTCCNLQTLLWFLLIASWLQTAHLILQQNLYLECSCLHATDGSNNASTSNNWRAVSLNSTMARNAKNDCYMIFISGSPEELVTFRFTELELRLGCLDYIEIFPYLREPVIENSTNPDYVVCRPLAAFIDVRRGGANNSTNTTTTTNNNNNVNGNTKSNVTTTNKIVDNDDDTDDDRDAMAPANANPIDIHSILNGVAIYSAGKVLGLRVRFKRPLSAAVNWPLSIKGEYRFLKRENFRNDGRLIAGSYCDYYFFADTGGAVPSQPLHIWQYFHSPRFPANYPAHIKCAYKFIGRPESRVEIIFEELHLPKQEDSCQMDKLTIFDAESSNMNAVIDVLCGSSVPTRRILSSGPDLLIEFNASSNVTGKGFRGKFKFLQNTILAGNATTTVGVAVSSPTSVHTTPQPLPKRTTESSVFALERIALQKNTITWQHENIGKMAKGNDECKKKFDSRSDTDGRFEASHLFAVKNNNNLPAVVSFPVRVQCRFEFYGTDPDERVQIKFLDFNIPTDSKNSTECRHSDSLQLLTQARGKYEASELFCGAFLPKPLMSADNKMVLQFTGKLYANQAKVGFYGFKAEYKFLKNFGITTGHQIGNNCSFMYNSTEKKSGWFGSPNFPGLYPHNVICNYYFYGSSEEYVKIRFTYFDVEGIGTCEYATASDYVEFSNFMSTDRKYTKYCGKRDKFEIRSDGRFFRITFFSNDRFDKTGFRALYDFENKNANVENTTSMQSYMSRGSYVRRVFSHIMILVVVIANVYGC